MAKPKGKEVRHKIRQATVKEFTVQTLTNCLTSFTIPNRNTKGWVLFFVPVATPTLLFLYTCSCIPSLLL